MLKLTIAACILAAGPATVYAQAPKEAVSVDLLITGGTIVTMDVDRRIIENGEIAVRGDTIIGVGQAPLFPKGIIARQRIDAGGKLLLPGFINGHTHVPMTLFRGLHDDVTLDDWLRKHLSCRSEERY